EGTGALSITSTGVVKGGMGIGGTSNEYAAIKAGHYSNSSTTDLTIDVAEATGKAHGIWALNDGKGKTIITNTGAVTGATGITIGMRTNNAAALINSYAPITGTGTGGTAKPFAIDLQGDGNDVVTLGPGTVINGFIDFGNGNDGKGGTNVDDIDTLIIAPGLNIVVHFEDASGGDNALASAPEKVSSNITLINGGTTAVTAIAVDPSGFAASGMFLGSFTGAILNSIDNANTPAADGNASSSFTGLQANGLSQRHWVSGLGGRKEIKTAGVGSFSANGVATPPYAEGPGPTYWISGFGGQQEIDADSNNSDLKNNFAGIMAGAESIYDGGIIGVLGGYGASDIDIDSDAGSTETDSAFAGVYWKKDYGTHQVNLALIGGSANQKFRRNITGSTSTSTAKGKTDGWFISPSATVTVPITAMPVTTFGSVRVSYAGLFLDDYTETGVATPLDVSDRDVHLLNARAQLTFPHDFENRDGSHSHLEIRAGVDAQYDLDSDKVNGVVGGTAIKFSADLDDRVSGFIGTTFTRTNRKGDLAFAISGEVQSTFDDGYQAVAEVRVTKRF
ncbi:MAG: autotransporter outer membrane beta-barrel domain-containing protein, partial [Gammaproteobacteria bacterium]|nr:autotransporter outer membrane beta-barrel domain-containing protein [Gammaproteobacteria bacterium]